MGVGDDQAIIGPDHTGAAALASGVNQKSRTAKLFGNLAKSRDGHVTLLRWRGHRQKWTRRARRLREESWRSETCRCFLPANGDRKSTRLNSSHDQISYAVFC